MGSPGSGPASAVPSDPTRPTGAFVVVSLEIVLIAVLAVIGIQRGFAGDDCGEVCDVVTPFMVMIIILSAVAAILLWRAWSRARGTGRVAVIGVGLASSTLVLLGLVYLSLSDGELNRVKAAIDDLLGSTTSSGWT
jgi:hypothetical protein